MNDTEATRVVSSLKSFLKDRFNLKLDQERESVTKADIEKGSDFKGATCGF